METPSTVMKRLLETDDAKRDRMPQNAIAIFAGTALSAMSSELKAFFGGTKTRSKLSWVISDLIEAGTITENDVRACSRIVQAIRTKMGAL